MSKRQSSNVDIQLHSRLVVRKYLDQSSVFIRRSVLYHYTGFAHNLVPGFRLSVARSFVRSSTYLRVRFRSVLTSSNAGESFADSFERDKSCFLCVIRTVYLESSASFSIAPHRFARHERISKSHWWTGRKSERIMLCFKLLFVEGYPVTLLFARLLQTFTHVTVVIGPDKGVDTLVDRLRRRLQYFTDVEALPLNRGMLVAPIVTNYIESYSHTIVLHLPFVQRSLYTTRAITTVCHASGCACTYFKPVI